MYTYCSIATFHPAQFHTVKFLILLLSFDQVQIDLKKMDESESSWGVWNSFRFDIA